MWLVLADHVIKMRGQIIPLLNQVCAPNFLKMLSSRVSMHVSVCVMPCLGILPHEY